MARSEVGRFRWNCQCNQMHTYTAEVRGAISIVLFEKAYPFCLKDDNELCHLAKLVSNWKCQNNTRTLTSLAQSQDRNPIENNLGDSQETTDNQTQLDRVAHGRQEQGSHPRPSRQDVHSIQTRYSKAIMSKGWPKIY